MTQPPARKFSGIFISYRREDSVGHSGRLYDHLVARFGDDQVFMDIDQIEPGEDFVKIIENAVGSCDVLLVVIGRQWLSAGDGGLRRLDNPNDFVRLEIAAALRRDILIVPVFVQGAKMPAPDELPQEMSSLSRRQGLELSDQRWRYDTDRLIAAVDRVLARQRETRNKKVQEEEARRRAEEESRQWEEAERLRRAAMEARQRREAAEAERLRQEAEEARRRKDERAEFERAAESFRQTHKVEKREDRSAAERAPTTKVIIPVARAEVIAASVKASPRPGVGGQKRGKQAVMIVIAASALVLITVGIVLTVWLAQLPSGNVTPAVNQALTDTAASPDVNSQLEREMITTTTVNLREGPNFQRVIGEVESGSRVRVLSTDGTWVEIEIVQRGYPRRDELGPTRGWVDGTFLR